MNTEAIVFRIGPLSVAADLDEVREVLSRPQIEQDDDGEEIIRLRGREIPAIDGAEMLGLPGQAGTSCVSS